MWKTWAKKEWPRALKVPFHVVHPRLRPFGTDSFIFLTFLNFVSISGCQCFNWILSKSVLSLSPSIGRFRPGYSTPKSFWCAGHSCVHLLPSLITSSWGLREISTSHSSTDPPPCIFAKKNFLLFLFGWLAKKNKNVHVDGVVDGLGIFSHNVEHNCRQRRRNTTPYHRVTFDLSGGWPSSWV